MIRGRALRDNLGTAVKPRYDNFVVILIPESSWCDSFDPAAGIYSYAAPWYDSIGAVRKFQRQARDNEVIIA